MKTKIITIFLLIFFFSTQLTFAKDNSIKYNLPYPGMLPDNPLYKLKVLRDRITLLLIKDSDKKIEYYLLMTDKGLVSSKMLVDKQKIELAKETALKGEHNYTLLTWVVKDNKWNIDKEKYETMEAASLKHQELLKEIIKKVPKEDKKTFETVLYFSQKNLEVVKAAQKTTNQK